MNNDDILQLDIEINKSNYIKKCSINFYIQRLINLNDKENKKKSRPIFIIIISLIHIFMYFLTLININIKGQNLGDILFDICKFFVPCMQPTTNDIRYRIVYCNEIIFNKTCYYDDILKSKCFYFTYPYQLWRMITVNLIHMDLLHLLSNLLTQIIQGILLEQKYGSIYIIIIYWLSELGATLCFTLKHTGGCKLNMTELKYLSLFSLAAIGASGSLYGLMVFFFIDRFIAIQKNPDDYFLFLIQIILFFFPYIIFNIPLMIKYNVAHSAHFGGGLIGFLLSVCIIGWPFPWNNQHFICQIACQRTIFIFISFYFIITLTFFFSKYAPVVESILKKS